VSTDAGRPPWRGRILALSGILLVALNLRAAVASLSPIADRISTDVPLDAIVLGVLGAAPPLAFALAGILTPRISARFGIEHTLLGAIVLLVVGQLFRAFAVGPTAGPVVVLVGSVVAFLGIGVGNVLMPPIVRRYFPDRIGTVTSGYVTVQQLGATVAPLVAVPLAVVVGWRLSIGSWGVLAVLAAVPWVVELTRTRGRETREAAGLAAAREAPIGRGIWRSPTAWAMAAGFSSTSAVAYVVFSAFPALLHGVAHLDDATGGAFVALFSFVGLPLAIVMPQLAARLRSSVGPALFSIVLSVAGFLGLLLAPAASPLLWMVLVSLGAAYFPYSLALVGARSRTQAGALALSGFMQGVGYTAGALGPLLVGILHAVTGGWTAPLIVLLIATVPLVPAAIVLRRPRFVEDDVLRSAPDERGAARVD
jgi:CP family cyanate transporter-like MFS transporter